MSGVFGPVAQIQVPDFGASLARAQGLQANRLAMLAQQRAMERDDRLTQFFDQNAAGFASPDAGKRMNLLAMLAGQGGQGAAMALPMLGQERQRQELRAIMNDEPIGGAPAQPMAVPGQPAPGGENPQWNDRSLPRGLRNNNPLNLSFVAGQPGVQGSDGRFGRYNSMEEGVAAATRQLQMYGQRGLTSVEQIIGRWAPPNENNTGAYVATVARELGVDPRAPLNLSDPMMVSRLVGAMARMENGRALDPQVAARGVQMALAGGNAPRAQGDTTPATTQAQAGAPQAQNNDARIAVLQRRAERLAAAGYQQEAQTTLALIQSLRRGEAEPLEVVERLDGRGVELVPRSAAAGRTPANRDAAPRSPERFEQDRQIAEAGAARSNTTVNSGDRRTDVLVADAWNAAEQTARDAGRRSVLLRRAEDAFQRFEPGVLAERRIWLGQMARELGINLRSTSEGEALQQVQRSLELAATPQGQGAITENERGLIREAVPVLLRTPEGAREAVRLIRALDDYEMQIARIYRDNARRNGGQPNAVSVREEIAEFVARNQPPDVQAALDPYLAPAQPAPPSGQGARPAQPSGVLRYNPRTGRIE